MTKFKKGDVISYQGDGVLFRDEIDRHQTIVGIYDKYITVFNDTGESNHFGFSSRYVNYCVLVDNVIIENKVYEYENGVPIIWEDNI